MRFLGILLLLVLHQVVCKGQYEIMTSDTIAKQIDKITKVFSERRDFSGSLIIEKEGQIILQKGYGMANPDYKIPFSPKTIFGIGTLSQQFTSVCILKLYEQQKIDLHASISNYLPKVPKDKKDITIHQLLAHTSGLPGFFNNKSDHAKISKDKALRQIFELPLLSKPGKKFLISNAGYTLLAILFEEVSGTSYLKYLRENIFSRANLNHTGFNGDSHWKEDEVAIGTGFLTKNDNSPLAWPSPSWNIIGNGEIVSNVIDMYKWANTFDNQTLLSSETIKLMHQKHSLDRTQRFVEYGYGWKRKLISGQPMIFFTGGGEYGQLASIRIYPTMKTRIFVLSNNFTEINPALGVLIDLIEKILIKEIL